MYRLGKYDRRRIASIFHDQDVAKIWFHLDDLGIAGKNLAVVAGLIISDRIKCYAGVPNSKMQNREAQYNLPHNTLLFSRKVTISRLTTLMQSIVLHEGVHAYIDHKKLKKTTYLHNEAAAFVTQGLFLRNKGESWPGHAKQDPVIQAVEALIDRFTMTSNRAWLNWGHFEPLMKAIQQHPAYRLKGGLLLPWGTKTPADGVAQVTGQDGLLRKRAVAQRLRGPAGMVGPGDAQEATQARGPVGVA